MPKEKIITQKKSKKEIQSQKEIIQSQEWNTGSLWQIEIQRHRTKNAPTAPLKQVLLLIRFKISFKIPQVPAEEYNATKQNLDLYQYKLNKKLSEASIGKSLPKLADSNTSLPVVVAEDGAVELGEVELKEGGKA
jgi:hypothetical protein